MSTPKHFSFAGKQSRKLIWTLCPWVEWIKHSPDHPKPKAILAAISAEFSFSGLHVWLHWLQQPKAPMMLPWAFRGGALEHCHLSFAFIQQKEGAANSRSTLSKSPLPPVDDKFSLPDPRTIKNRRKMTLGVIRSIKSNSEWHRINNLIQEASIKGLIRATSTHWRQVEGPNLP